MKQFWKRMLAGMLTVIMLASMMPPAAYAAVGELAGRSSVENAALLEALRQVYGDDAEAYLAVLEQYGLIDEDGNFVTDEEIVMDGVRYTLDEIKALLDDPDTDLDQVVEVDGQHLTLHDLKLIVEIEEYLAYLKATYFTDQDLTDEQIGSFYDLANAWANGDVMMLSANNLSGVGPAGVDHGVRLTVTAAGTAKENSAYAVTVKASTSAVTNQAISFSWRAVSGSVNAAGGGTVTMHPGESRTLSVDVGEAQGYVDGEATFLVQIYNVKNALVDGSTRWEKTVTVAHTEEYKYTGSAQFHLSRTKKDGLYLKCNNLSAVDIIESEGNQKLKDSDTGYPKYSDGFIIWGDPITLKKNDFQVGDGNYEIIGLTVKQAILFQLWNVMQSSTSGNLQPLRSWNPSPPRRVPTTLGRACPSRQSSATP